MIVLFEGFAIKLHWINLLFIVVLQKNHYLMKRKRKFLYEPGKNQNHKRILLICVQIIANIIVYANYYN